MGGEVIPALFLLQRKFFWKQVSKCGFPSVDILKEAEP